MDYDDFKQADPDFGKKLVALCDEIGFGRKEPNEHGITGVDYYMARWKAYRTGELQNTFAETAEEWLAKEREQLTQWKANFDAQHAAKLEPPEDEPEWSPW